MIYFIKNKIKKERKIKKKERKINSRLFIYFKRIIKNKLR